MVDMNDLTPMERLGTQRDAPLHFAGRREELAELNGRLNRLCKTGDPTAGISLIVGVPGAGKTQLAREFANEATKRDDTDIRWLNMDPATLTTDIGVFRAIGRALGADGMFREVAEMERRTTSAGGSVSVVRGSATWDHVRHTGGLDELLPVSKDKGAWDGKTLIVTIDELQAARPQGMDALRILHQGAHDCPIMLVGIGLQHLPDKLANPGSGVSGISREAQTITLGSLPMNDAIEAIALGMDKLGQPIPDECAEALAKASHGFPQHIHGYIKGALDAVAEFGQLALGQSLAMAMRTGNQARVRYYNSRLRKLPDRDAVLPVVLAMPRREPCSLRRRQAVDAVNNSHYDGEATIAAAIEHGVLTVGDDGSLSFGIPSLHAHMLQLANQHRSPPERQSGLGRE